MGGRSPGADTWGKKLCDQDCITTANIQIQLSITIKQKIKQKMTVVGQQYVIMALLI